MSLDLAFRLAMQDEEVAKSLGELVTKKKVLTVKGLEPNSLRKITEIKADKVYEMILEDGEAAIFHFEVQGKSSHRDMPLRMFDYITRIISQAGDLNVRLYSVVIYLDGAGTKDDGNWTFGNPPIGNFQYTPLKLWELDGDVFLEGDNINLLAFLPQMKLSRPKEQVTNAMQRISSLENKDHAAHLLYILAALTQKKGLKPVVDSFMTKDMMLNAPDFIRDAYLEARDEGLKEGLEKGEAEGEKKGVAKGFVQAKIESVLQLLQFRFRLGDFDYNAIQSNLKMLDVALLDKSFEQSLQAESLDDVKTWLSSLKL